MNEPITPITKEEAEKIFGWGFHRKDEYPEGMQLATRLSESGRFLDLLYRKGKEWGFLTTKKTKTMTTENTTEEITGAQTGAPQTGAPGPADITIATPAPTSPPPPLPESPLDSGSRRTRTHEHQCPHCEFHSKSQQGLRVHIWRAHTEDGKKAVSRWSGIMKTGRAKKLGQVSHRAHVYRGSKIQCPGCERTFANPAALGNHLKSQSGQNGHPVYKKPIAAWKRRLQEKRLQRAANSTAFAVRGKRGPRGPYKKAVKLSDLAPVDLTPGPQYFDDRISTPVVGGLRFCPNCSFHLESVLSAITYDQKNR